MTFLNKTTMRFKNILEKNRVKQNRKDKLGTQTKIV